MEFYLSCFCIHTLNCYFIFYYFWDQIFLVKMLCNSHHCSSCFGNNKEYEELFLPFNLSKYFLYFVIAEKILCLSWKFGNEVSQVSAWLPSVGAFTQWNATIKLIRHSVNWRNPNNLSSSSSLSSRISLFFYSRKKYKKQKNCFHRAVSTVLMFRTLIVFVVDSQLKKSIYSTNYFRSEINAIKEKKYIITLKIRMQQNK